ncbi:MAG TPA: hypothetical protein VF767_01700 [Bryobacteraceae bacterium]
METMLAFTAIAVATLVALFAALALESLLLRAAFALMQPATAGRRAAQQALEQGVRLGARAYGQRSQGDR